MSKQTPIPLIIDTDPGCDDAIALMLLAHNSDYSLKGVTTVAGNSTIENTTRNARYVLDLVGCPNLKVYSGANKPIKRSLKLGVVHGETGLEGVDTSQVEVALSNNADQFIIDTATKYPNELVVLALGPLTNLANAILKEPKLPTLLKRVVIMGGAIKVPGNKSPKAEFNFYLDPEAVDLVVSAQVEKVLVPLDLCNQVALTEEAIKSLRKNQCGQIAAAFLTPYLQKLEQYDGLKGAVMYDPLAAYYLINPTAYKLEQMDLGVETQAESAAGMVQVKAKSQEVEVNQVKVAFDVDQTMFKNYLFETIRGLP